MKPGTRRALLIGLATVAVYLLLRKNAGGSAPQLVFNNPDPKCTYCPPFTRRPGT